MRGRQWLQTKAVREWLQTERGQQWLHTERGQEWLDTPAGQEWLDTPAGREWPQTVAGRKWLDTPEGQQWLRTPNGLQSPSGRVWLRTPNGLWLKTSSAQEWLQTWQGREWLQTQSGREWLQTPHGQAWQMTPAASVWVTMNEFSSTSEATSEYTIVPEIPLRAAFQVIEQFKNLPDFLGFPAFLAFQPQDHSTHAFQEDRYLPDIEVIYAMTAFVIFAKEARERSQSASDALKYACQNWAFHLLRALSPWDGRLNTLFKLFWDHHLLAWLERQWCLKGLRSCLLVLSEGQKLAKERLFQASGSSQS
ncbi:uncharacterized protein EDB91DRAFT_1347567 [Suillus paluster]|uniref:uncharacterized protein n=1 Tax=Suillus paluster TaxID=48578 RepID=UPI001B877BB0|nr:uncharacterized protein EDB91DRAFT_1347567 [Suillus paluster]KAG1738618.1 hypothetical protein EDB91DRAFT_1347567 [Suillus paluster]